MFNDVRSKRIILVAHCVLNQNSISDGTADYAGANCPVVELLLRSRVGIVQLPCPELNCLGLDRGNVHGAEQPVIVENSRIRKAMNRRPAKRIMKIFAQQVAHQVEQYRRFDFTIVGIVGINRSPSCGVNTTSMNNREVEGKGVWMQALYQELDKRGISIPMVGIKALETEQALQAIQALLGAPNEIRGPDEVETQ